MRWMIVILALFLSGCIVHSQGRYQRYQGPPSLQTTTMTQVDTMVGAQQPAAYKVGFMQGCDSGRLSAGDNSFLFKKDTNRFDTDDVYQQGWNDGFNRCVSGAGVTASNYYQGSYGYNYYYPSTFSAGFYYPSYYYAPGFSIWSGYYYPRNRHYAYNRNYYYTPWYGGHKHRGGGYKGYRRGPYISKHRGGGGSHIGKRGGGGHKSRGGGSRGGSSWIR